MISECCVCDVVFFATMPIPRIDVPMFVYDSYPAILNPSGTVTSFRYIMSRSCFRMNSASMLIRMTAAMPLMLRFAIFMCNILLCVEWLGCVGILYGFQSV
jgi:hypothetical protein